MCFALVPGTYLCPLLLAFLHDQSVLWLHGCSTYSPPMVLCLSSGSSASSPVFTLEAGWCLLHHIWNLTPPLPSRLSPSATALCIFPLLLTLALPAENTFPKYQTYKVLFLWLPGEYISGTLTPAVSTIPLGTNFPGQTQDQVTARQTS